jgi:hypothetical protein
MYLGSSFEREYNKKINVKNGNAAEDLQIRQKEI